MSDPVFDLEASPEIQKKKKANYIICITDKIFRKSPQKGEMCFFQNFVE